MGVLLTERFKKLVASAKDRLDSLDRLEKLGHLLDNTETPEFTGHLIWGLFNDPNLMAKSGQTFIGAELAAVYGIKDAEDREPSSYRDLHGIHPIRQFDRVLR